MKDVKVGDRIKVTTDMPDGQPIRLGDELRVKGVHDDGKRCAVLAYDKSNVMFFLIEAWFDVVRKSDEQAEREKDPFAPGKWVVCVEDDAPAKAGDVLLISDYSGAYYLFRSESILDKVNMPHMDHFPYRKSHFRPATPEEIKEQEMKIMDEKKADEARANRQTFTVGCQEFYVGQAVWAEKDGHSFSASDEFEVIGPINNAPLSLCVRKPSSSMIYLIGYADVTTEKPKPHEWKFGDWARHPEWGVVLVGSEVDDDGYVVIYTKDGFYSHLNPNVSPKILTYISTAEIPE